MSSPKVRVIPNEKLFVSEPDPRMFGNGANPSSDPTWTNKNWLKSRFHFSFAEYSSRANPSFGSLRVMNDDLVQPRRGFGTHGHSNMEIITYIVHGKLTHKDSMSNSESLGRGSIQFMTAGSGVRHSEFNNGGVPLRFIQTWIVPNSVNLPANYGSHVGSLKKNELQHLVSSVEDSSITTPVSINQDCSTFASELENGQKISYNLGTNRQVYLLCVEGGVKVNGQQLHKHDACEITDGAGQIEIEATHVEETEHGQLAHILMFEMKAVAGSGRTDF
jgi:redox-sensitive bicupin YhaK (pirin superfamily)